MIGCTMKAKEGGNASLCVAMKERKEANKPREGEEAARGERSRGARATSWIEYHLTGPAGSLPAPQHRKTSQYGGQLLLPA